MFMRKSLFSEFNGFSEDFFMNFEETEFQKRIANSGFPQFILNDTKIIHIGGGSGLNCTSSTKSGLFLKKCFVFL